MIELHTVRMVLRARPILRLLRPMWHGQEVDAGALLHAGLANLFATSDAHAVVPMQPFAVDDHTADERRDPEHIFLRAYSQLPEAALLERMGPLRAELVAGLATRAVPALPSGTRLAFRARVCPTVRTKRPAPGETARRSRARDVDAWLAERLGDWRALPPSEWPEPFDVHADRERVYRTWLSRELGTPRPDAKPLAIDAPAAEVVDAKLVEFRSEPFRRDRPRTPRSSPAKRPNAVLAGTLRVVDPTAFRALLARGVGRHRAYGFGMLVLRPVP